MCFRRATDASTAVAAPPYLCFQLRPTAPHAAASATSVAALAATNLATASTLKFSIVALCSHSQHSVRGYTTTSQPTIRTILTAIVTALYVLAAIGVTFS